MTGLKTVSNYSKYRARWQNPGIFFQKKTLALNFEKCYNNFGRIIKNHFQKK